MNNMTSSNDIVVMNNLRSCLHYWVYNDPSKIQLLLDYINSNDLIITQDINYTDKSITLKIKKMNMKKMPKFSNDVLFYYGIINNGYIKFLQDENVMNTVLPDGKLTFKDLDEYKYLMADTNRVSLLYNINIISDISIILYL